MPPVRAVVLKACMVEGEEEEEEEEGGCGRREGLGLGVRRLACGAHPQGAGAGVSVVFGRENAIATIGRVLVAV